MEIIFLENSRYLLKYIKFYEIIIFLSDEFDSNHRAFQQDYDNLKRFIYMQKFNSFYNHEYFGFN